MATVGPGIEGFTEFERVGGGGNSILYRARQEELDRAVAVKVLSEEDVSIRRRFDRERRALGRLSNHPGVVTIYESGFTEGGKPYLVMPWIEGGSLQDHLDRRGPLPPEEAASMVADAAETLQAVHESGVIHADIKPANLLLDDNGRVLVADFGIARFASLGSTRTTSVSLTPSYAAPELILGEDPSPATDVYGLGATLFALIEGHPPFGSDRDLVALADAIVSDEPPVLGDHVPQRIRDAYRLSAAKSPQDRFDNAAMLAATLTGTPPSDTTWTEAFRLQRALAITGAIAGASLVILLTLVSSDLLKGDDSGEAAATVPEAATSSSTTMVKSTTVTTAPNSTTSTISGEAGLANLFAEATIQEIPVQGSMKTPTYHQGRVWVVREDDSGEGSLLRFSATSGALIDSVEVGRFSTGPVFTEDAAWLFDGAAGVLTAFDTDTMEVVHAIEVSGPRKPYGDETGRDLDQPVVAADGSIWLALNTLEAGLARVYRVDSVSGEVEQIPAPLGLASVPVASDTAVWITGYSVCLDDEQYGVDPSEGETDPMVQLQADLDIPFDVSCSVAVSADLTTREALQPIPVDPNPSTEWVNPDSQVPTVLCPGTTECFAGTRPGSDLYDYWEWVWGEWEIYGPMDPSPASFGAGMFWAAEGGAVFTFTDTADRGGVFDCEDKWAGKPTVVNETLWISVPLGAPCAFDLNSTVDVSDQCDKGRGCLNSVMESVLESGLPFYLAPTELLDEEEYLTGVVPSGYLSSVWATTVEGKVTLITLPAGEEKVAELASFEGGLGARLPMVAPDGSAWLPANGRLTRIRPALSPDEFSG